MAHDKPELDSVPLAHKSKKSTRGLSRAEEYQESDRTGLASILIITLSVNRTFMVQVLTEHLIVEKAALSNNFLVEFIPFKFK